MWAWPALETTRPAREIFDWRTGVRSDGKALFWPPENATF